MGQASWRLAESFGAAYRQGARLALLFDYDGTLAPLAPEPQLARLEPASRALLERLASLPRVEAGVVSGRALLDLRHMVALPCLSYAGTGGQEVEARGVRRTDPRAESYRVLIGEVGEDLLTQAKDFPGAWVEDKLTSLTLHYRHVAPERAGHLLDLAAAALRAYEGQVRVVQGPLAWEVCPATAWDKGDAVRAIVQACGHGTLPLYVGDSANDAPAMDAAVALGGVAVAVGDDAPAAACRLAGPDEVRSLLELLVASLVGHAVARTEG